ncbi:hypothetical protein BDK51DRAFT_47638 [Blyttiomyces helicus]|uniref:Uncharacterized protein n=1 Tax=Blyttiomyces helicus TaxID=388810 RepID=A0A4P9WFY7_9FUNG|nr:hypothetical protein BDK51DRAFT_47638 [Blyttiomyces helicus]|eukprot:RKO90703.1 hypothetical protein BDK51DRAFT_47638 [Blyttiomyces helicus]
MTTVPSVILLAARVPPCAASLAPTSSVSTATLQSVPRLPQAAMSRLTAGQLAYLLSARSPVTTMASPTAPPDPRDLWEEVHCFFDPAVKAVLKPETRHTAQACLPQFNVVHPHIVAQHSLAANTCSFCSFATVPAPWPPRLNLCCLPLKNFNPSDTDYLDALLAHVKKAN